jgi:hypothetical protein
MKEPDMSHEEFYSEINTYLRMEAEKSINAFVILQLITVNS